MKKLGFIFKEISAKRIKDNLEKSNSIFIVKFPGLSSPDITTLRQALKKSRADLFVVKNSVVKRTLKDSTLEPLIPAIEGSCGMVFTAEEPVETSRILYNFSREHEQLKLAGGAMSNKLLDKKDIETLARLPSKEILRGKAVMALKSPIFGLVYVLSGNLRKLVYCLEQIKNKKGG
jgi:large subunit ribosomal protein L10